MTCLDLGRNAFLKKFDEWLNEFNEGKKLVLEDGESCPYQLWIIHHNAGCGKDMISGLADCPICGEPICPDCGNHRVTQLSRVTGYIGAVDGWNASKKQELKDRRRTDLKE